MRAALQLFKKIIEDNKKTMATYDFLHNYVKAPYDNSDLLRWQWIQSVSALDKLVHDLVRIGLTQEFLGLRNKTAKFLAFPIAMNIYTELQEVPKEEKAIVFEKYITERNKSLSFQDPDKIKDGLALISNVEHKWQYIANKLSESEDMVRKKLKNISIRRNQIVHEGDYANPNSEKQQIFREDVEDVNQFISDVGTAIFDMVIECV